MRARFVGGRLDGSVRFGVSASEFVNVVPVPQSMTAQRAKELLGMYWQDRPRPQNDLEFYKRTVERDDAGQIAGFVYTYDRTERR